MLPHSLLLRHRDRYWVKSGVFLHHAIMLAQVRLERAVPYVLKLLTESQQHDAIERACTIKVVLFTTL